MADILAADGKRHRFRVQIVSTPADRSQGLQGRKQLAADAGMLFDFGVPLSVYMWMKNTYIALDIIFIAPDGRIVNIARGTTLESLAIIESAGPVRAVLEVPVLRDDRRSRFIWHVNQYLGLVLEKFVDGAGDAGPAAAVLVHGSRAARPASGGDRSTPSRPSWVRRDRNPDGRRRRS